MNIHIDRFNYNDNNNKNKMERIRDILNKYIDEKMNN